MFTSKLFVAIALSAGLSCAALPAVAKDINPPAGDWTPGDYPSTGGAPGGHDYLGITGVSGQKVNGQDLTREYKVHIPKSYRKAVSAPLLFCFHSLDATTSMFCVRGSNTSGSGPNGSTGGFIDQSENNGFILVMVQGYKFSWNAGACCAAAVRENLDDVALMRAILAEVKIHLNIDIKRVYAAGFSNGAFLSDRLACEASDMIAGIIEGSGGIELSPMSSCKPQNHVPVLAFHGTKDPLVPYASYQTSIAYWAQVNGCDSTTTAASFPNSGGDTTCVTYTGCPAGVAITGCTVDGGGHCWFGSPSCGGGFGSLGTKNFNSDTAVISEDMWPFLSQFHR